ncbi:hypothetical protein KR222_008005 [Zaprionus bogoriensis]|nr:hypothetical protein KR222_008005 [Zaprionus bogoriensis]
MFNSTDLLLRLPLLHCLELLDNAHLVVTVAIALCILLWYAAKFESDQILRNALRRRRQQQLQLTDRRESHEEAALTLQPFGGRPFGRLNPIQSVERRQQQLRCKRVDSAASVVMTDSCTETPTCASRQSFSCLNPEQSVERQRRWRQKQQLLDESKAKEQQSELT